MAGHTKGPWRVDPASNCDVQTLGGGQEVASTHPGVLSGGYCDPTTAQANARLIASAPELLEALEGILGYVEGSGYARLSAMTQARAAINLATKGRE